MKITVLTATIAIGLAAGFLVARQLWPEPTRPERIAQVFEDLCIQRAKGNAVSAERFGFQPPPSEGEAYTDPMSMSFVRLTKRGCEIQTIHPFALTEAEAQDLLVRVTALRNKHFPDLPFDPGAVMGTINAGWAFGRTASKERWGMFLFAYPDWGESAGSILTMYYPPAL
jgi:hypothetical protein